MYSCRVAEERIPSRRLIASAAFLAFSATLVRCVLYLSFRSMLSSRIFTCSIGFTSSLLKHIGVEDTSIPSRREGKRINCVFSASNVAPLLASRHSSRGITDSCILAVFSSDDGPTTHIVMSSTKPMDLP